MPFVTKEFFIQEPLKAFMFLENVLHYSSKEAQKIIDKSRLRLANGEVVKKSQIISGKIYLDLFEPQVLLQPFFIHRDFALFNKPHNLLTHPKGRFDHQSLCDSIKGIFGKDANPAHRLDFETSGIILATRNKKAEIIFKKKFENNEVDKIYLAWVWGRIEEEQMIDMPILAPTKAQRMLDLGIKSQINAKGKRAITWIKPLKILEDRTLLEIKPITGRTHQIRLHLFALGHPIINEPLYGVLEERAREYLDNKFQTSNILFLHAKSIEFDYENQKYFFSTQEGFDFKM